MNSIEFAGDSPEAVALFLTLAIARLENVSLEPLGELPPEVTVAELRTLPASADRVWLLDTYAECIAAVRDPVERLRLRRAARPTGSSLAS
jgi:hypothetical protein